MSPQPAASQKTAETPAANNGGGDPAIVAYIEAKIAQARGLEKQRYALQQEIADNRSSLRKEMKSATDAQAEWIETFYPEKEKGSNRTDEENTATRKLREAARK